MVGTQHAGAGKASPDVNVDVLVDGIRELLRAVRVVRQAGGSGHLPPRLVQACREVVDEAGTPAGSRAAPTRAARTALDSSPESLVNKALRELPLRRLLWQIIEPGETFAVSTVVDRLAGLGMDVESAKVSNALGYWVDRARLVRERKGIYTRPLDASDTDLPAGRSRTGSAGGSTDNDRRRPGGDHKHRAMTARGQEEISGQSPVQRRKAV